MAKRSMIEREKINHIEFDREVDSFLSEDENKYIEEKLGWETVASTTITLPVCKKHCHNVLMRERKKYIEAKKKMIKQQNHLVTLMICH